MTTPRTRLVPFEDGPTLHRSTLLLLAGTCWMLLLLVGLALTFG